MGHWASGYGTDKGRAGDPELDLPTNLVLRRYLVAMSLNFFNL